MDARIAHLPRRIANLSNDQPDPATISEQVHAAVSQQTRRSCNSSDLDDAQRYLQIPRYLLMTAFCPHCSPPTSPSSYRATTRQDAWGRVYVRVRQHFQRPDWNHAGNIDSICHIFPELLRELGRWEYPLYILPPVAGELFPRQSLV